MRAGLSSGVDGDFELSLEYGNVGEMDLDLKWRAKVRDAAKSTVFQSVKFSGADGLVLPMETKRAHGVLNTQSLGVGEYLLVVEASSGKDKFNWEYKLTISQENETKYAELIK